MGWIDDAVPYIVGRLGAQAFPDIFKLEYKNTHCVMTILRNILNMNKCYNTCFSMCMYNHKRLKIIYNLISIF